MTHYFELSEEAAAKAGGKLSLLVWPETMYRRTLYTRDEDVPLTAEELRVWDEVVRKTDEEIAWVAKRFRTPILFGIDAVHRTADGYRGFNATVATDREGRILDRYEKMHLVMFGEYIPFAHYFPWLYSLTPLAGGATAGTSPRSVDIEGVRYSPNICFESVIPHVIASQVRALEAREERPDVLVNLTNDAWFRGSSELDMHLVCGVFRAIECRRPFLIAANGGISAAIDSNGRIRQQSPRMTPDTIVAQVSLDDRRSFYLWLGDWPAGICLAACAGLIVIGIRQRWKRVG